MNRILTPIVAMFVSLLMLAGCQETDAQVQAALSANCPAVEQNYALFTAVTSAGTVSAKTAAYVAFTKQNIDAFCTNPESATVATVVAAATLAMLAMRNGIAEAQANGADVGYPVEMRQLRSTLSRMQKELNRHGR